MPVATPLTTSPEQLDLIRYNDQGLVAAIIQEHGTGTVLMLGWMNDESVRETLESGRTVFWSRSRQERWRKGDTSGDRQWIREAWVDCDGDALLFVVEQEGRGACHTGSHSCFARPLGETATTATVDGDVATGAELDPDASEPAGVNA